MPWRAIAVDVAVANVAVAAATDVAVAGCTCKGCENAETLRLCVEKLATNFASCLEKMKWSEKMLSWTQSKPPLGLYFAAAADVAASAAASVAAAVPGKYGTF